jgi:hypothetical protein
MLLCPFSEWRNLPAGDHVKEKEEGNDFKTKVKV